MTTFRLDLAGLSPAFDDACRRLHAADAVHALWSENLTFWSADASVQRTIGNRLGWLRALDVVEPELARLRRAADDVRQGGFDRVLLVGMGGSSLAPEVLRRVLGVASGYPRFEMLDSVNPDAVRAAMMVPARTFSIVASKSGTTIEPTVLLAAAQQAASVRGPWGPQVAAITDPDTALHAQAQVESYRHVFVNPSAIGGRYSALSLFGLVPAALMGADLEALVRSGHEMASACQRADVAVNPGFALGAFMAAAAREGRDKLTLVLPDRLDGFGLWVEQLVAESTGKGGTGIVPITGEPDTTDLGADRACVFVRMGGAPVQGNGPARAMAAGVPAMTLDVASPVDIAGEFLRWEVATAMASWLMGVNPFDEPNVQQAKTATRGLLDVLARDGALPEPAATARQHGVTLSLSRALSSAQPWTALPDSLRPGDYVAVLAYAPPGDAGFAAAVERARLRLGRGHASSSGFGPRYLHSTGQLHKGGPNTGVFLVIVTDPDQDLAIPGHPFTFGQLERAQALGDFASLDAGHRRAAYLHLPRRDPALLDRTIEAMVSR